MADSAASSTSRSSGPATTKRRARATSSNENKHSSRAAIALEPDEPVSPVLDTGRESEEQGNAQHVDLPAGDDAQGQVQDEPQAPSFDPRQGTLLGFEMSEEAPVSVSDEAGAGANEGEPIKQSQPIEPSASPSVPAVDAVAAVAEVAPASVDESASLLTQPISQQSEPSMGISTEAESQRITRNAPSRATNTATSTSRRQAAPAQIPEFTLRPERVTDALSASAFADAMASIHRTLADERSEATKRAARANRMLTLAVVALIVSVLLGVAQAVALRRLAQESAADQQRLESLLVKQQAALAAVADAASSAAAAAREPAIAAGASAAGTDAAAVAAPKPVHAAEPLRAAHSRHSHLHKAKAKEKA
jgi:hypothetical protein